MSKTSIGRITLEAFIAGILAYLVFAPLTGIVLDGYDFNVFPERPLTLAAIVFAGRFIFALASSFMTPKSLPPPQVGDSMKRSTWITLGVTVVAAIALGFIAPKYWLSVFILCLIYVLLGLGLNIVVGLAGLLDLGYVAFYAVGAYGYALAAEYFGLGFWTALPLAALAAALCGTILGFPVLKMHGDYLAIVTLGFGEIISLILVNWTDFTGGPNGISAPPPTFFGMEFKRRASEGLSTFHETFGLDYSSDQRYIFIYLCLLAFVLLAAWFVIRLKRMPIGRAWEALRQDEIACRSLGINHVAVKLSAFALGASIGGIAGVFFAGFQGFINPMSFNFFESALILAIVVLGGMGSTLGVILAAVVLTMLPEFLREFSEYRIVLFGILMVLMMIWRPRGLILPKRHRFTPEEAT